MIDGEKNGRSPEGGVTEDGPDDERDDDEAD